MRCRYVLYCLIIIYYNIIILYSVTFETCYIYINKRHTVSAAVFVCVCIFFYYLIEHFDANDFQQVIRFT